MTSPDKGGPMTPPHVSVTMPLPPPPTMTTFTWDDQTEELSTVLRLMSHLMPQVQSCCCDNYTPDNKTETDGKTSLAINWSHLVRMNPHVFLSVDVMFYIEFFNGESLIYYGESINNIRTVNMAYCS